MKAYLYRFIKFGIASTSGTGVNMVILYIGHGIWGFPVSIASPIAIGIAIFNNFTINDYWTFHHNRYERKFGYFQRLLRYYISSSLGAFINYTLLITLVHSFGMHYLIANLIGSVLGSVINYCLVEFWVFR